MDDIEKAEEKIRAEYQKKTDACILKLLWYVYENTDIDARAMMKLLILCTEQRL